MLIGEKELENINFILSNKKTELNVVVREKGSGNI